MQIIRYVGCSRWTRSGSRNICSVRSRIIRQVLSTRIARISGCLRTRSINSLRPTITPAWLAPTRWPVARKGEAGGRLSPHARFVATPFRAPGNATGDVAPLVLLTGRLRDQWHTMTRTGLSPRLGAHLPEPFVEVNPLDAAARECSPARRWTIGKARWCG